MDNASYHTVAYSPRNFLSDTKQEGRHQGLAHNERFAFNVQSYCLVIWVYTILMHTSNVLAGLLPRPP